MSVEGRVEYQKLNQTVPLLLFSLVFRGQIDSQEKSVSVNAEKRVDFTLTFLPIHSF